MHRPADDYSYAYLLGMYLGDGHLADTRRSFQLRIALDGLYPGIVEECAVAMILSLPSVRPAVRRDRVERRVNVMAGSKHWPSLFPQMGPAGSTSDRSSSRRGSSPSSSATPGPSSAASSTPTDAGP